MQANSLLSAAARPRHKRLAPSVWVASALLAGSLLFSTLPALADTTVKILSPSEDASVQSPVTVKYRYHKEGRANHIHVIVDGQFMKVSHKSPVKITLPSGKHTILLQAATSHHNLLDASDKVDVQVK